MRPTTWTVRAVLSVAPLCLLAAIGASELLPAAPAQAGDKNDRKYPTLEGALKSNAPKILDSLRQRKLQGKSLNAGVIRFRVQVGDNPASDNIGPLNLLMASRLEAALILALNDKDKIRILHNPSAVVWERGKGIPRADPDDPAGRKAFFEGYKYPAAWGEEKELPPHLFLTGLVKIDDEAKTMKVFVRAFDSSGEEPKTVCEFEAIADPRVLTEAGISFALRSRGNLKDIENLNVAGENQDSEWQTKAKTVTTAVSGGIKPVPSAASPKKANDPQPPPAAIGDSDQSKKGAAIRKLLREAPIQFEVFYDDEKQSVRKDGSMPNPPAGSKIKFLLKHKGKDDYTYGVVLKINGRNTILPRVRHTDDSEYIKWVLAPGEEFEISNYHLGGAKAKEIVALTAEESKRAEAIYGRDAGMFTVVIFQGRSDGGETRLVRLNGNDEKPISRGVPPIPSDERNDTLKALQRRLLDAGKKQANSSRGARGMIVPGKDTEQEVKEVPFKGYPIQVSLIQIRYYKPQDNE